MNSRAWAVGPLMAVVVALGCAPPAGVEDGGQDGGKLLAPGTGYGLVYSSHGSSGNIGIDSRSGVDAGFNSATGALTGYYFSTNEHLDLASGTAIDVASDGVAAIGAWTGGPTSGRFNGGTDLTFDTAQGAFHYGVGVPTAQALLPTSGTRTYTLRAATHPTTPSTGNTGTLDSATVVVDFASHQVGVELAATFNGATVMVNTTGGAANLSASEGDIDVTGNFAGAFSVNMSSFSLRGFVLGAPANEAVISVTLPGPPALNGAALLAQ